MALSDLKIRALKPKDKPYKVSDGEGLHLFITPNGTKAWRLSYRFLGKQKTMALGIYPTVSLLEARSEKDDAKRTLAAGQDPGAVKKQRKKQADEAGLKTFETVAEAWLAAQKKIWAPTHYARIRSRFDEDVFPAIGKMPISLMKPTDMLPPIKKIEKRGALEIARRILQHCGKIFRYGVANGICERDITKDLVDALAPKPKVVHRNALKVEELPHFFAKLDDYQGEPLTRFALELVAYTFLRTKEIRLAKWTEFEDLHGEKPIWRIPAERMKMKREHIVPLAPHVLSILARIKQHSGDSEYLFPSTQTKRSPVISENTLIYALYKLGYHSKATVHGFRRTASTVMNEQEWNRDWIEMQLAHAKGDVRSVYNAAQYLTGRRKMMLWYADFLDQQRGAAPPDLGDQFEDLLG